MHTPTDLRATSKNKEHMCIHAHTLKAHSHRPDMQLPKKKTRETQMYHHNYMTCVYVELCMCIGLDQAKLIPYFTSSPPALWYWPLKHCHILRMYACAHA